MNPEVRTGNSSARANFLFALVSFFVFSLFISLIASALFVPSLASAKAAAPKADSWTDLARKVGESEDGRADVIARLRKIKSLKTVLKKAIYTKQRPLALDVISALELKELVPDLLFHVPADPDGFLTVAINAMMDPSNQTQILKSYSENLNPNSIDKVSAAAIVAMLEPVGRLSVVLSKETIAILEQHASPEVRASTLYYIRIMGLRNKHYEALETLTKMLKAGEFQLRLQAVSIGAELLAQDASPKDKLPSRDTLKDVCDVEKTPSIKSACLSFIAQAPRIPASADADIALKSAGKMCSTMQEALYKKSTIRIRMVFGYKDARPARFVGDRHERLAFLERITSVCADEKSESCGFARSHSNADLFMKKSIIKGKERKILLWVVNSSVGTDDQENQTDPFQRWKSKYAEQAFLSGLRDTDVVMYDGHSRFGGGPDFYSPKLASDGTVDPTSYQEDRPGLTKMMSSLKGSVRPKAGPFSKLKLLGLFSCSSSQHFTEDIHTVSKAGMVTSKVLMYYSDALEQSLATVNDVLLGRCPSGTTY